MDIETLVITIYISICTVVFFPFAIRYWNRRINSVTHLQKKNWDKIHFLWENWWLERIYLRLGLWTLGWFISLVPPILLIMIWREKNRTTMQEKKLEKSIRDQDTLYKEKVLTALTFSNSFVGVMIIMPLVLYLTTHESVFTQYNQNNIIVFSIFAGCALLLQTIYSISVLIRSKIKYQRTIAWVSLFMLFPIAIFLCISGIRKLTKDNHEKTETKELDNLS